MKTADAIALLRVAGLVLGLGLGIGAGSAGAAGGTVARGVEAVEPASNVGLATALMDAHRLAARSGDKVVRVSGDSMLPYFGDGAVLVVRPMAVDALREGIVVLYRNRFGETVAHRIEGRVGESWRVRGANNAESDSTPVSASNLMGAVYVTFYSDPGTAADGLRLAAKLAESTPVALAATAR